MSRRASALLASDAHSSGEEAYTVALWPRHREDCTRLATLSTSRCEVCGQFWPAACRCAG